MPHSRVDHRIDYLGRWRADAGLVPLLIVAEQGREWGWGSAAAITMYAIGAIGLVAFVFVERAMGDEALLPLRLFRTPGVLADQHRQLRHGHRHVRHA